MILNTIAGLSFVSLLGFLRVRMRFDRIIAWFMLFCVSLLFINYGYMAIDGVVSGFSLKWHEAKIGNITIDFFPKGMNNELIIPMFFVSLLAIFYNNIFRFEEKRSIFNSLIILNFISLSLLICAKNYIQLITSVFVSDIVGYIILKDVDSSRRYVIYNFLSDMCLFMVFSLVSGRLNSLDISQIITYKEIGAHKDFVGLVTMIALFIKIGVFSFHTYLLDISNARFQRMSAICTMFAPLSGILLLLKLHNLLIVSDLFIPIYKVISVLTFLTGILLFIIKNDIRKKIVYFNMANWGGLMLMIYQNSFEWNYYFSYYYIFMFLYNIMFFKLYVYQNRENSVVKMVNAKEINKEPMYATLVLTTLLTNLFIGLSYKTSTHISSNVPLYIALIIVFSIAIVLNHIYKSPISRRLEPLNDNPKRVLAFIVNLIIISIAIYHFKAYSGINYAIMLGFIILIWFPVFSKTRKLYNINFLQNKEICYYIYNYLLIVPVMYVSRMMWLMVDTVFYDRVIKTTAIYINRSAISLFFKFNKKNYTTTIIYILIGILIFIISFYKVKLP